MRAFSLYRIKHRCNCSENHKFSKFRSWKCTWTDPLSKNYNTLMSSDYKRRIFLDLFFLFNTASSATPQIHCIGWRWDWTQDWCDLARRTNHSARSHPHSARSHPSDIPNWNFAFNLVRWSSFCGLNCELLYSIVSAEFVVLSIATFSILYLLNYRSY